MDNALVTRREYTNLFRSETTDYLKGNVGDVISVEIDFSAKIQFVSESANPSRVSTVGSDRVFEVPIESFESAGFGVGDSVDFFGVHPSGISTGTATISLINEKQIICSVTSGTLYNGTYPSIDASGNETGQMLLLTATPFNTCELNYNLLANSNADSFSLNSLIDGSILKLIAKNIDYTDTSWTNFETEGNISGMSIITSRIRGQGGPSGEIDQLFTVNLVFQITPFYDSVSNFEDDVPPSWFFNQESLTDVFKISFLPEESNPNRNVQNDSSLTKKEGNVKWFSDNDYQVNSVRLYNDDDVNLTGIDYENGCNFTIKVNDPNNSATSKYKFGFMWVPDNNDDFINNQLYHFNNLLYNGLDDSQAFDSSTVFLSSYPGKQNIDGAAIDINDFGITLNGNEVILTGEFKPNAAFSSFMDSKPSNDRNYIIWLSVGDETLTTAGSDRESVLCQYSSFVKIEREDGAFDFFNKMLDHPQPTNMVGDDTEVTFLEDDLLMNGVFRVDTANGERVDKVTCQIEAFNSVTGNRVILESFPINTSVYPSDDDNIQLIDFSDERGFKLVEGNNKNIVQCYRSPVDDSGNKKAFRLLYSMKIRWEDWIQNLNVTNDFLNPDQLQNGRNNNWYQKDIVDDYQIFYSVLFDVSKNGEDFNYRNSFPLTVKNYEESDVWDGEITHYNSDESNSLFIGLSGTIRNNGLLSDKNTVVWADFDLEDTLDDVGDVSDYYGVIRIEEYQGAGFKQIRQLSTEWLSESDNILIPLDGEDKCQIIKISPTKIRLKAQVDYSRLNLSTSIYKTSARIGCRVVNVGKYSKQYSLKYD